MGTQAETLLNQIEQTLKTVHERFASHESAFEKLTGALQEFSNLYSPSFFEALVAKPWWQGLLDVLVVISTGAAVWAVWNTSDQLKILKQEADRNHDRETKPKLSFSFDNKSSPILVNTSLANVSCATVSMLFRVDDYTDGLIPVAEMHGNRYTKAAIAGWVGPEASRDIGSAFTRFLNEIGEVLLKKHIDLEQPLKFTISVLLSNRVHNDLERNDYWLFNVGCKVGYCVDGKVRGWQFMLIIPGELDGIEALKQHEELARSHGVKLSRVEFERAKENSST